MIDWADLTIELQLQTLAHILDNPDLLTEVVLADSSLSQLSVQDCLLSRLDEVTTNNRRTVAEKYSLATAAARLIETFDTAQPRLSPTDAHISPTPDNSRVLAQSLDPHNIHLLTT